MNEGMIRCLALMRAIGTDPVAPGGNCRRAPAQEPAKREGGLAPVLVIAASFAAAFAFASLIVVAC